MLSPTKPATLPPEMEKGEAGRVSVKEITISNCSESSLKSSTHPCCGQWWRIYSSSELWEFISQLIKQVQCLITLTETVFS